MSETLLIGKAKELYVATLLASRHLHIYFPLVDNGFDFVVSDPKDSKFMPVQVKYKNARTGFTLSRTDGIRFAECSAVIAFGSGEAEAADFYFFPAKEWLKKALEEDTKRADGKLSVYLAKNVEWIKQFQGHVGLSLAFGKLLN